ncbi:MAG: hypothetical protein M0Q51_11800 [Bacteroidales bacterium]|nr:hypothetical protein [Bacteroidales bacterium]
MKKIVRSNVIFILLIVFVSTGCVNAPVIVKPKVEGKYVKVKDNGRGSSLNLLNINLIKEVNFGEKICRFDYFGTTMGGKYTIDGNYVYIEVGYDIGTLAMEIVGSDTLEGEGWISGTFIKQKPK